MLILSSAINGGSALTDPRSTGICINRSAILSVFRVVIFFVILSHKNISILTYALPILYTFKILCYGCSILTQLLSGCSSVLITIKTYCFRMTKYSTDTLSSIKCLVQRYFEPKSEASDSLSAGAARRGSRKYK